ncbi:hypothetical protein ZWY2020_014938 [Hordeum vulgare]|nr:hypothetical protein ZWY2020_014938 [Hordeum vulgare]
MVAAPARPRLRSLVVGPGVGAAPAPIRRVCRARWEVDLGGCSGDPFPFAFITGGGCRALDRGRLPACGDAGAAAGPQGYLGDPLTCYSCKRHGHLERGCPVRLRRKSPASSSQAEPVPKSKPISQCRSPPVAAAGPAKVGAVLVVSAAAFRAPATGPGLPVWRKVAMAYVPGEALRRPASSSCKVVGTPAMEAEAHRLRSSALVLSAVGHFSRISAESVARAVERELRFPASDFVVVPFFPEDFLLTMFQPAQRDMALERRSISVAGVMFKLRPWLSPAGTSRIWRYYCYVAIEKLPLTAWDWDSVKEVLCKDCELDLIERQSTTKANCATLFAWL